MIRSVLFALTLSSSLALAQPSEEDSGTTYPCPLAGLKNGKVTVTGEGGVALFDGKKRLATLRIPEFDFNASKGEVTCKGEKISIHSQMPYKATTQSVDVTWKEGKLEAGTPEVEDPSVTSLEAAEKALKEGRIEEALTHLSDVAYPHNYYSETGMAVRILRRGHEVARQRYKARDAADAAKILGVALEHATAYVSPSEEREGFPAAERSRGSTWVTRCGPRERRRKPRISTSNTRSASHARSGRRHSPSAARAVPPSSEAKPSREPSRQGPETHGLSTVS
jgi:hypothetical protein